MQVKDVMTRGAEVVRPDAIIGDAQFFHTDRCVPIEWLGITMSEVLRMIPRVGGDLLPERDAAGLAAEETVERVAHAREVARNRRDVGHHAGGAAGGAAAVQHLSVDRPRRRAARPLLLDVHRQLRHRVLVARATKIEDKAARRLQQPSNLCAKATEPVNIGLLIVVAVLFLP